MIQLSQAAKRVFLISSSHNHKIVNPLIKRHFFGIFKQPKSSLSKNDEDLFSSLKDSSKQINSLEKQDFGMSLNEIQNVKEQTKQSTNRNNNHEQSLGMTSQELKEMMSQIQETYSNKEKQNSIFQSSKKNSSNSSDIDLNELFGNKSNNSTIDQSKESISIIDFEKMSNQHQQKNSFLQKQDQSFEMNQQEINQMMAQVSQQYNKEKIQSNSYPEQKAQINEISSEIDIKQLFLDKQNKKEDQNKMSMDDFKRMSEQNELFIKNTDNSSLDISDFQSMSNSINQSSKISQSEQVQQNRQTITNNTKKQDTNKLSYAETQNKRLDIKQKQQQNNQLIQLIFRLILSIIEHINTKCLENRELKKDIIYLNKQMQERKVNGLLSEKELIQKELKEIGRSINNLSKSEKDKLYDIVIQKKMKKISQNHLTIVFYLILISISASLIVYLYIQNSKMEQELKQLELQTNLQNLK